MNNGRSIVGSDREGSRLALRRLRGSVRRGMLHLGFDVRRVDAPEWADFSDEQLALCAEVQPYTQTSRERIVTLADAVEYVVRRGVPGDFVESGVWLGGSAMVIARTLIRLGVRMRGYGSTTRSARCRSPANPSAKSMGNSAGRLPPRLTSPVPHGAYLPQVRANLESTGYPPDRISYVCGLVEETIPASAPQQIALLRLDTDWHSSTAHKLEHLYPRLSSAGVLIVDDYGHYRGARKAVDEYFERFSDPACQSRLHRPDGRQA